MPNNVKHFSINADNVPRARKFYEGVLGLKPTTLNSHIQRLGIDVNLYRQTPPNVSYETFEKFVLWKAGRT